jgi:aminoglycoside phosphotransferase (APT) family kinase protein
MNPERRQACREVGARKSAKAFMMVAQPDMTPTPELAASAAAQVIGRTPIQVLRFQTGAAYYVFDARFADGHCVVIRMGRSTQRASLVNGWRLNRVLRPLGVPLPEGLAEGLNDPFPWIALERLPGTDLGHVMDGLSDAQLQAIARGVVEAQAAAAQVASVGRYGYGATAGLAPYRHWSDVVEANLARSRSRIADAGLFGLEPVHAMASLVEKMRGDLDALPPVAFLHDTTTKNVMVAPGGELSGIVDVDDLCFGDPRYAVALTLSSLIASAGPCGYVEVWMRAAGHRDDEVFRLYVALFLLDFMGEHGQRFNGNEPASTPEARSALRQAFEQALDRVRAA